MKMSQRPHTEHPRCRFRNRRGALPFTITTPVARNKITDRAPRYARIKKVICARCFGHRRTAQATRSTPSCERKTSVVTRATGASTDSAARYDRLKKAAVRRFISHLRSAQCLPLRRILAINTVQATRNSRTDRAARYDRLKKAAIRRFISLLCSAQCPLRRILASNTVWGIILCQMHHLKEDRVRDPHFSRRRARCRPHCRLTTSRAFRTNTTSNRRFCSNFTRDTHRTTPTISQ